MRKTLKNSAEVFHFWANQVQSEGKAGNVFFDGAKVYSYGMHFCIARILPSGVVAFTTRGYSPTTSGHINEARSAARHLNIVYCNDPSDSASDNMRSARYAIRDVLNAADKPRIRQTTRVAKKALALQLAEQANAYLAALPADERGTETPIDTTALEAVRAELIAAGEAAARMRAEQHAAQLADLQASLTQWRNHEIVTRTGLYNLPPALRLGSSRGEYPNDPVGTYWNTGARDIVQTSHGAEIPVADAIKLWPVILRVKAGTKDYTPGTPLGSYQLTQIRTDGSLRVGCHDIAFSEIEAIALQLGLISAAVAA